MFLKSNYPMISIFIEIWQSYHFLDGSHFEKKMAGMEIKFNGTIMLASSNYPYILIFIEIRQSLHFLWYGGGHFEKKTAARK